MDLSISKLDQILWTQFNWFLLYMEDIEYLYPVASLTKIF
jgi:hypothetical protein